MAKRRVSKSANLPVKAASAALPAVHAELVEQAREYARAGKAPNTRRAYATGWKLFEAWCVRVSLKPLPAAPETVALFLTELASGGAKPSTIALRLAAIVARHRDAGHAFDGRHKAVGEVMAGIRRTHGTAATKKTPILSADLRAMLETLPNSLAGARDRALLLIGFGAALRRSELAALDVDDLSITEQGLVVRLRRSKTDQEGSGVEVAIHRGRDHRLCAVAAYEAWIAAGGIKEGPLFRPVAGRGGGGVRPERLNDRTVALIVQRAVARAGLDPSLFAAHSLRAGLATSAALAGADLASIMRQTRHKSVDVARGYVRVADIWRDNVTARVL